MAETLHRYWCSIRTIVEIPHSPEALMSAACAPLCAAPKTSPAAKKDGYFFFMLLPELVFEVLERGPMARYG